MADTFTASLKITDLMDKLLGLLKRSANHHHNLCPRQVLGVRMGMLAGKILQIELPQKEKHLLAFVESDGCGMGGIAVATGCWPDRRTLFVFDYGKLAATFIDIDIGRQVRIHPKPDIRMLACHYAPDAKTEWEAQLKSYQIMLDEELFAVHDVDLIISLDEFLGSPGLRVSCDNCGEEIINGREIRHNGYILCRPCSGDGFYVQAKLPDHRLTGPRIRYTSWAEIRSPKKVAQPVPVISVIGKSKCGKTTFLENLIRELGRRSYRVAAIKRHFHKGFDIDIPGKDSWRFAQAGSDYVTIAAPDKIATYRSLEHELSLDEITADIDGVDLILVEGFCQANKPAIEVVRASQGTGLIGDQQQHIAIVTDASIKATVPIFHFDDVTSITDLVLAFISKC